MKVLRWLDSNLEKVLLCTFLAVIAIIMFLTIVLRNVISYSISWSDELARYLFVWIGAIGVSFATKRNAHIRMDVLCTLVPKLSKPLSVLSDISLAVLAIMLIRGSIPFLNILSRTGQVSGGMQIPMKFIYVSFTIGFGLTVFRVAQKYTLLLIKHVKKPRNNEVEEKK